MQGFQQIATQGLGQVSDAWKKKQAQMSKSKKSKKKGISEMKTQEKSDKGDECEAILENMDAYPLSEQIAAVKYQRKNAGSAGLFACFSCSQTEAEDQLCENLMVGIEEATAALDPKDLWATWMKLYKLMRVADKMGWQDQEAYQEADARREALGLSMDDTMDLDKVEVTDAKALATLQSLFDTCSIQTIDGQTPLARVKINKVFQIFHEQTRAEYLLKRQQIVDELDANPGYEKVSTPSQQVSLARLSGGYEPVDPKYNEFYLFHGTSDTVANLIADSDFLIKSSADNGWTFGKGVYAAEWVSHAQMFAMMGDPGCSQLTILVCRALGGRIQRAPNWPNTASPCPQVAQLEANIQNGSFHATTGSEWPGTNFQVHDFIIPDDDQILPEFICHCSF